MRVSSRTRRRSVTAAVAAVLSVGGTSAFAADTWDNSNGNANWSTVTNWADDSEPQADDAVTFPLAVPAGGSTIAMGSDEVANSLTFNNSYTLNGGALTLGPGGEITVAADQNALINANLTGSNGLTKLGTGTLFLTAHTFTGQVEVTQGTLKVVTNGGLGNINNNVLLNGGILLAGGSFTTSRPITVGGGGGAIDAAIGETLVLTQPLVGPGSGPLTLTSTLTAGSTGNRTIVLAAADSNRDSQTFIEQGTVRVSHGGALGSGAVNLKLNGSLDLFGTTVDLPMSLTGGTLQSHNGNSTYAGTITVGNGHIVGLQSGNAPDTLTVGNAPNDFTGGGFNAQFARTIVSGAGRVRLAQPNNYQGDWQVNGGILTVGNANALGTGVTPINMISNSTILELANGVALDRGVAMANTTAVIGTGASSLVGTVTVASGGQVTFGGAADKITLGNAANDLTGGGPNTIVRKTGPGVLELTQRSNLQAGWDIQGGTVVVKPGAQLGGNGAAGASAVASLAVSVGGSAKLDLTSTALVVRSGDIGSKVGSNYTGLAGLIQSGRNGGAWNGLGIMTSTPAAATGLTAIGIATQAQLGRANFGGVSLNAGDAVLMYTYMGDANLDGFISGDDYTAIDFNIAVPGANTWVKGDFNYDGIISGDDYSAIDFNIVAQGTPFPTSPAFAGVTAVPEPTDAIVVIGAATAMFKRRRRGG